MTHDRESKRVTGSRVIAAPASDLFAIVSDPSRHGDFDGSDTVKAQLGSGEPLALGSKFGMRMRWGVPYVIRMKVVEFEPDRLITWRHPGRHSWSYQFEELDDSSTRVTETFDYSRSPIGSLLDRAGICDRHVGNIDRTLERLAGLVE